MEELNKFGNLAGGYSSSPKILLQGKGPS